MLDKEVRYRIFRIVLVIFILVFLTFLRESVKESYVEAKEIESSLENSLVLKEVSSYQEDNFKDNKGFVYEIKVINNSFVDRDVALMFEVLDEESYYKSINYQIIENNEVLKIDTLGQGEVLWDFQLSGNSNHIYKIKFTSVNGKGNVNGKIVLV